MDTMNSTSRGLVETAENPLSNPENLEKLELAREFILQLAKGAKNISVFRHNTSKYKDFVQRSHEAVEQFTQKWGSLLIKVEAQCFSMFQQPIYEVVDATENLPYRFFKDGIRHIIFRRGITAEEILDFALMGRNDSDFDDGVLSQMWKRNFKHLEYVVVQGLSFDETSEAEVQVEMDKVIGYLYSRLQSRSNDYMRFARVSTEDLGTKFDSIEQLRGVVVSGSPASEQLITELREGLREDEEIRLFPKLLNVVFQVLDYETLCDIELIENIFVQILDAMLFQEDFCSINGLRVKLRAMAHDTKRAEFVDKLTDFLLAKMGEEQRIRHIGEILNSGRPKQPYEIVRYLSSLDSRCMITLLEVLEGIEISENRQIVCDALVLLGKEKPEPFVNRMQSEKSQLVHDMIYIIDKCNFPDKTKYYGEALKNSNLVVRLEALSVISRTKTEQCRRLVVAMLDDPNAPMRIQAAKILPEMGCEKAMLDLMEVIRSPRFIKRDFKEKEAFYRALGSTLESAALVFFADKLSQKSLLHRAKVKEEKLLAIMGLSEMPSIPAYKTLQTVLEEKSEDPDVVNAARRVLFEMKNSLSGTIENRRT